MTELRTAALGYAQTRAWRVLPLEPGGKRPLWGLGWEDASSEPAQIESWWEREPAANIGVACHGELLVLDIDGDEGEASFEGLCETYGGLPDRALATLTGRGRHLYFRHSETLDGWRWAGLELKAKGYVVAPPSRHESGRVYHFPEPDLGPVALPAWLAASPRPRLTPPPIPDTVATRDARRLAAAGEAALRGELAKLAEHPADAGTERHTALFAAAAALGAHVATGSLAGALVEAELGAAAGRLGLPLNAETWHQIDHGLEVGAREPYRLRERPRPERNGHAPVGETEAPANGHLRVRAASELTMRWVDWLWDERLPLGKLSVLGGLPGQGKSLLTCWIAARATRGELPGTLEGRPTGILIVSAEDDPEDTILPRLYRCGADPAAAYVLDVRESAAGKEYTRSVSLPRDTPAILAALEATGARLLILDPIGGLLDGEYDSYKAQHVRAALGPLKAAAEERHAAVVLVQHILTKGQGNDPLARLADSHAYAGLPRSVLTFGPDPEDEDDDRGAGKVLALAKSNVAGRGQHGLRFSITDAMLVGDGVHGLGYSAGIRLDGPTDTTAADTLASSDDRSAMREAVEFLRELLSDGPARSVALRGEAEGRGISLRTLERARAKVCRRAYREGDGPWMVALKVGGLPNLGGLGGLGGLPIAPGSEKTANTANTAKGGGKVIEFRLETDPDADDDPDPAG